MWGVKGSSSSSCAIRAAPSAHFWWPSLRPGAHVLGKAGKSQNYKWKSSLKAVRQGGWPTKQRLLLVLTALNIRERKRNLFLSQWWVRTKQNPHHPPERCLTIHLKVLEGEVVPVSGPRWHLNSASALSEVTQISELLLWPTWEFFIIPFIISISHQHWSQYSSSERRNRHRNVSSVTSSISCRRRLAWPELPQCRWQMVGRTNLAALA